VDIDYKLLLFLSLEECHLQGENKLFLNLVSFSSHLPYIANFKIDITAHPSFLDNCRMVWVTVLIIVALFYKTFFNVILECS